MGGIKERLAAAEVQLGEIAENGAEMKSELRAHFEWQRAVTADQEKRLNELESGQRETRTHLAWMKGIWAAVQGAVLGWVGLR